MELWVLGFCQVSAQREHSVWVHAEIEHPHKRPSSRCLYGEQPHEDD